MNLLVNELTDEFTGAGERVDVVKGDNDDSQSGELVSVEMTTD